MKLTVNSISQHLKNQNLMVEVHASTPSTNTLLKQRAKEGAPHGMVIAAETQTAGRGRMGRDFFSPAHSGIYFSVLLRPKLKPEDCLLITTAAAVACADVLEQYTDADAKIKWVNDIYIENKKVCGILTEASFNGTGTIDYAVLGIGINITPPESGFPAEIINKAGAVLHEVKHDLRGKITAEILNKFFDLYESLESREFINEYRSRSLLDGMAVDVIKHDCIRPATALFVDEALCLVVQYSDGTTEALDTGDVSIKTV